MRPKLCYGALVPRKSPFASDGRTRLSPVWVPCICVDCGGYVKLRSAGKGAQPLYCSTCIARRKLAQQTSPAARVRQQQYDATRKPVGKKSAACTDCGKPVWLGRGSRETPTCRDCRNRPFWHICDHCNITFVPKTRDSRFCSADCWYAELRLYDDRRQGGRISSRKRRAIQRATWDGVTDEQIWERDGWVCSLGSECLFPGKLLDRTQLRKGIRPSRTKHPLYPTVDHIVPLSRGGADTSVNKRAAHLACNCARGARMTADEEALAVQMPELAPSGVWPRPKKQPKPPAPVYEFPCDQCGVTVYRKWRVAHALCDSCRVGKCSQCGRSMTIVHGSRPPETRTCRACSAPPAPPARRGV